MAGWIAPVLGALGIGASIYGAKKAGDVADVSQDYYNASAEQIRQAIDLINKSSAVLQPYLTQGAQLYSAIQPINYALLGLLPQAGQMQPTNIQSALGPTELQYALGQVPTGTTPTQEAPPAGLTAEDLAYLVSMLQKIGSGTTAQTPTTPATLPPLWQDIVPQTPTPTPVETPTTTVPTTTPATSGYGKFNMYAQTVPQLLGLPANISEAAIRSRLKELGLPTSWSKNVSKLKNYIIDNNLQLSDTGELIKPTPSTTPVSRQMTMFMPSSKTSTAKATTPSTLTTTTTPTTTPTKETTTAAATGTGTAGSTATSGGTTQTGTGTTATSQQVPPNLTAEELNNLVAILNKVTPTTQQATTGSAPGEAQIPGLNADLIANLGTTGTTSATGTSYKPAGTTVNGLPAGTPTFSAEYIQALQNILGSAPWMNPTEVPTLPTLPQGLYGQLMENVPKPSDIGYQVQQSYNTLANKDLADLAAQRQQAISSYMARQGLGGSTMDISKNLGLENWYNTQKALMAAQGTQARLEAERQARAEQQNRADLLRGWDLESYDKEVTRMLTQQALAERQQQASKQNFFDLLNYLNQQATGMMGLGDMTGTAGNLLGAASGLANVGSGVAGLIPDTSSFWTGLGQLFAQKGSSTPATTVNVSTQPTSTSSSGYKPIYPWSVINSPLYGG